MTDDTFIPMKLDVAAAFARFRQTGDVYDTVTETEQNAFDSAYNPLQDQNEINIIVPSIGDELYRSITFYIEDFGAGITKNYAENLHKFLGALKAKSNKALTDLGKYGVGMILYLNLGHKVVFVSRNKKMIYKFEHFLNKEGIPGYDNIEEEPISPESEEEFGMYHSGTKVTFYGDVELDVNKVRAKIQKIYGWRMGICPNIKIRINGDLVELPEDLKGKKLDAHLTTLSKYKIKELDGTERTVNPRVTGFIEASKKGAGKMRVHVRGYYIQDIYCAQKQCEGALNIDELPIDLARKQVDTNSKMLTELLDKIEDLMAKYPDVETDKTDLSEKKIKSLEEQINKALARFNLPKLWRKNEEERKRQKIEEATGSRDGKEEGYVKGGERAKPQACKKCGHLKRVLNCDCPCHIVIPRGPPTEISTVGGAGTGQVTVILATDQQIQQKDNHFIAMQPGKFGDAPLFSVPPGSDYLRVNSDDGMFHHCFIENQKQTTQRISPFLAFIVMDAEYPNARTEKTIDEYMKLHETITYQILDGFGHHVNKED